MTTDERLTEAFELIKDLKFVIESNQDRIKALEEAFIRQSLQSNSNTEVYVDDETGEVRGVILRGPVREEPA